MLEDMFDPGYTEIKHCTAWWWHVSVGGHLITPGTKFVKKIEHYAWKGQAEQTTSFLTQKEFTAAVLQGEISVTKVL